MLRAERPAGTLLGEADVELIGLDGASPMLTVAAGAPPVTLRGLKPKATYHYAVRSGGAGAAWSAPLSFRAGYAGGATRIGIGRHRCTAAC